MTKTVTTGILTEYLRDLLEEDMVPSNIQRNEFDPKDGRVTKKIIELPVDLELIASSPNCWRLLSEKNIRESIYKMHKIMSMLLQQNPIPIRRIKCIDRQRGIFSVEIILVLNTPALEQSLQSNFVKSASKLRSKDMIERPEKFRNEYYLEKIKENSNLRHNEWSYLLKHYKKYEKKNPFYLPLKIGENYKWTEIKKELSNPNKSQKSNLDDPKQDIIFQMINPILDKMDKKRDKIINRDLDKIDEILKKHGYKMDRADYPHLRKLDKIKN